MKKRRIGKTHFHFVVNLYAFEFFFVDGYLVIVDDGTGYQVKEQEGGNHSDYHLQTGRVISLNINIFQKSEMPANRSKVSQHPVF